MAWKLKTHGGLYGISVHEVVVFGYCCERVFLKNSVGLYTWRPFIGTVSLQLTACHVQHRFTHGFWRIGNCVTG